MLRGRGALTQRWRGAGAEALGALRPKVRHDVAKVPAHVRLCGQQGARLPAV